MTDRLDRIEAILESTATQQAKTADEVDTLLGAAATNEAAIQQLTTNVDRLSRSTEQTEQLFNIVRGEAAEDRAETRRLWNDAVTQMERDRIEARAEREATAKRFDAQLADSRQRFDAQQEVIQRLLVELVEMNRDNRRLRDRVDSLEQGAA